MKSVPAAGGTASLELALQVQRPDFQLAVDLQLPASGITVLFGPSGAGKTTLLRTVAGLEHSAGRVILEGEVWQDSASGQFLPTWRRPLGYVFQEASLFEHLRVSGNLYYGLRYRGARLRGARPRGAPVSPVDLKALIELLGIGHLLRRYPSELSGGERQRVAIARAMATGPQLLLLDEPLAALDRARRQEILPWLERLRDEFAIPMLYVTHSVEEMSRLADSLVILEQGQVRGAGNPAELLAAIDPPLIRGEEGAALLAGCIAEVDPRWHLARVDFAGGGLWLRDPGLPAGSPVRLRVLARDVSLATREPADSSILNHLQGVIVGIADEEHPAQCLVRVRCGASSLLARVTRRSLNALALSVGSPVWVQVKSVAIIT